VKEQKFSMIRQTLKKLALQLLDFDSGDIMLLSELLDDAETLTAHFEQGSSGFLIVGKITHILSRLLKSDPVDNAGELLIMAVDMLGRLVDSMEKGSDEPDKTNDSELDAEVSGLLSGTIEFSPDESEVVKSEKSLGKKKQSGKKKPDKKKKQASEKGADLAEVELPINSEPFKIFLVEAEEKIIESQALILDLENDMENIEILHTLFRIFHTIKGECGFLRLASLGELTHNLENLLDMLRNRELDVTVEIIDLLLSGIDTAGSMLEAMKNGDITILNQIDTTSILDEINCQTHIEKATIGEILVEDGKMTEAEVVKVLQVQKESSFTRKFGEIAVEQDLISEDDIKKTLSEQTIRTGSEQHKSDPFIKVRASQINYLVDMVGELLIAENQLDENDRAIVQIKKITREIQNSAMKLRTIKIKNLFIHMKRLVRDVSKKLGKAVVIETVGEDLEVDRNLIEILDEPLMHILRNSVHHGIESAEERSAAGKDESGMIWLSAERRGNTIVIIVRDDGGGIDTVRVIEKAVSNGVLTEQDSAGLTHEQAVALIFHPGLSTAKEVNQVSGRGVGMDVVKTMVARNRGKIEVKTEKGEYTEVSLYFPISMAIIDGMIVEASDTSFIIPVNHIIESLIVNQEMIHSIRSSMEVINLRDEVIPIINLSDFFNLDDVLGEETVVAVIVQNREKKFAFIVNRIIAKKEIVIKPLNKKFRDLRGISSGTILAGGKIGFIVDIEEVVTLSSNEVTA
jgi:two-component system chemotaxis sensor kinase CheA